MGAELLHTDGRTDTAKLIVAFLQFRELALKTAGQTQRYAAWINCLQHGSPTRGPRPLIIIIIIILHAPLLWATLHALVVSCTVTYVDLVILPFLDTSLSAYLLELYSLSNDRLSVSFLNSLLYLLISKSLLTGQFSDHNTAALSLSLSCSTSSHSHSMWSIISSPLLQEHMGLSLILYLNTYDLILPCHVTIVVKFGVTLIFSLNLSDIFGKKVFVIAPFVLMSHSLCHFVTLYSFNSRLAVLFGSCVAHVDIAVDCCLFRGLVY